MAGVGMVAWLVAAVIAILFGALAFVNFRNFQKRSALLNRAKDMTGSVDGRISEVVKVYRRNNTFRWKNEYPVVAYQIDGRDYTVKLEFAEKRSGPYRIGDTCQVRYVPAEPSCSIVEEFRKPLESARTRALAGAVILGLFFLNALFSLINGLGSMMM